MVENVIFYSGSIGLSAIPPAKAVMEWDCRAHVRLLRDKLIDLVTKQNFKYLLNHQASPAFGDGWKQFYLYNHEEMRKIASGESYPNKKNYVGSFSSTGSISSFDDINLRYKPLIKLLCPEKVFFCEQTKGWSPYDPSLQEFRSGRANTSSAVPKIQMNNFIDKLTQNQTIRSPVFSISDCNSFHTSGYLWGLYAYKTAIKQARGEPVAILNFDQHSDAGGIGDYVRSDGWGRELLKSIGNGVYFSIGNADKSQKGLQNYTSAVTKTTICVRRGSTEYMYTPPVSVRAARIDQQNKSSWDARLEYACKSINKLKVKWSKRKVLPLNPAQARKMANDLWKLEDISNPWMKFSRTPEDRGPDIPVTIGESFKPFWTYLLEYLGKPIKYIFITVDRDSLKGHHTQWGDGCIFREATELLFVMNEIISALYKSNGDTKPTVIGFDVTGLPEHTMMIKRDLGNTKYAWGRAYNQLTLFSNYFKELNRLGG